ncbi:uncharacterized protein [Drosophila kikkawai]|uniref:Integrase catalytic domain-containing protein n=1 Tax=Drosophila kikkawai TaxID=30033 RepID=A0ABM4GPH1_DROKI
MVSLGNKIDLNEDELIEYMIAGIPDVNLRNMAKLQNFSTKTEILEAFIDIELQWTSSIQRNTQEQGPVHRLRSDNGKNFVGADREARRFGDVFETERIQSELSSRSIEWVFNCPSNPSEGGVWERMVQCVKRVLRHTLMEVAPRDHVLESLLIEAENVVNSRPLTHLPVDADQEAPLTPNDLLKGAANLPKTPGLEAELPKEGSTRKQWRIARMLRDRFWRRREWRKGIVEEVYSGADGVVRRASVRVSDNGLSRTMLRPVSKLAVLDLSEAVLHGVGDVDGQIL